MTLMAMHKGEGAVLDGRGLPRHYGELAAEYQAAREAAVLIDRSGEGVILLEDADRLAILHRISTNAVEALQPGEGRATILTTPIGRIIDRVVLHNLDENRTLVRTSAGRAASVAAYLRKNVFFRDRMKVHDRTDDFVQLMVYGPQAGQVLAGLLPDGGTLPLHHVHAAELEGVPVWVFAADQPGVDAYGVLAAAEHGEAVWAGLRAVGDVSGLVPSGLEVYDLLRVEAGMPGPDGELTSETIPLEAGLWADVSFTKGCYTGQEIIARMESRGKLARQLVSVSLSERAEPGSEWRVGGRVVGSLTSVAQLPEGQWIGLGFVKPGYAEPDQALVLQGATARIRWVVGREQGR